MLDCRMRRERLIQTTESGAHQVPARLPDATRAFTEGFERFNAL